MYNVRIQIASRGLSIGETILMNTIDEVETLRGKGDEVGFSVVSVYPVPVSGVDDVLAMVGVIKREIGDQ